LAGKETLASAAIKNHIIQPEGDTMSEISMGIGAVIPGGHKIFAPEFRTGNHGDGKPEIVFVTESKQMPVSYCLYDLDIE
jgi:hypothetical protein